MFIKKIATTLTDSVGKIYNSITSSVDKEQNAPSINYMEESILNSAIYDTGKDMGEWTSENDLDDLEYGTSCYYTSSSLPTNSVTGDSSTFVRVKCVKIASETSLSGGENLFGMQIAYTSNMGIYSRNQWHGTWYSWQRYAPYSVVNNKIAKFSKEYFKYIEVSGIIGANYTSGTSVAYNSNITSLGYTIDEVSHFLLVLKNTGGGNRILNSVTIPKVAMGIGGTQGMGFHQCTYMTDANYLYQCGVSFTSTTNCLIFTNERTNAKLYAYVAPTSSQYKS